KYTELPEWLRTAAQQKYKDEGEAKGLYRELNGKVYDLRTNPAGWVSLPTAEVVQIIEDGYIIVDRDSLQSDATLPKVFKLKHNGLARILNSGDVIQVSAMSAGTYTYRNKNDDVRTVPVYDPGMPVGPLRERVVTMSGTAAKTPKQTRR